MDIPVSSRIHSLAAYAFAEVDKKVQRLKAEGIDPIDFGVGDPTTPTPGFIREACKKALDTRAAYGYPSYTGDASFREAAAAWIERRFGVKIDPATEVTSTIGSKEGIFNFSEGFLDPGDIAICPTPGYPPYSRGTRFAEAEAYFVPLRRSNAYLPDLAEVPDAIWDRAKILWLCYPNSPTGAVAPRSFYEECQRYSEKYGTLLVSDEAYIDIFFGEERPVSLLELGREGVVAFFSLSKRSAMTGWRVGYLAGDRRVVEVFRKVKTNIDSGTPTFIQDAAAAALGDEEHVAGMREEYRQKRDILVDALVGAGLPECRPESTLYVWQETPEGMSDVDFAKALLAPDVAVVTTPGSWIAETTESGENPGRGHVRFALVPSIEQTKLVADRIREMKF